MEKPAEQDRWKVAGVRVSMRAIKQPPNGCYCEVHAARKQNANSEDSIDGPLLSYNVELITLWKKYAM